MNVMIKNAPLIRTAFALPRQQIRSLSIPRNLPKEIRVNLTLSQLFQRKVLNQSYLERQINESLKPHVPEKMILTHTFPKSSVPEKTIVYSRPPTEKSEEFRTFVRIFHHFSRNPPENFSVDYRYEKTNP